MIHFWCSISITDTFRVYQYHKSLIHDCDPFTTDGKKDSLFTILSMNIDGLFYCCTILNAPLNPCKSMYYIWCQLCLCPCNNKSPRPWDL